jgi:hypothetical protein
MTGQNLEKMKGILLALIAIGCGGCVLSGHGVNGTLTLVEGALIDYHCDKKVLPKDFADLKAGSDPEQSKLLGQLAGELGYTITVREEKQAYTIVVSQNGKTATRSKAAKDIVCTGF